MTDDEFEARARALFHFDEMGECIGSPGILQIAAALTRAGYAVVPVRDVQELIEHGSFSSHPHVSDMCERLKAMIHAATSTKESEPYQPTTDADRKSSL